MTLTAQMHLQGYLPLCGLCLEEANVALNMWKEM